MYMQPIGETQWYPGYEEYAKRKPEPFVRSLGPEPGPGECLFEMTVYYWDGENLFLTQHDVQISKIQGADDEKETGMADEEKRDEDGRLPAEDEWCDYRHPEARFVHSTAAFHKKAWDYWYDHGGGKEEWEEKRRRFVERFVPIKAMRRPVLWAWNKCVAANRALDRLI